MLCSFNLILFKPVCLRDSKIISCWFWVGTPLSMVFHLLQRLHTIVSRGKWPKEGAKLGGESSYT